MLLPAHRRIVLIGAGHTNLHVVRMWMQAPIPQTRLTLVSAGSRAAYSGMLPGCLAGLYPPGRMLIDLHRLCGSAGVELIAEPVEGLHPARRQIMLRERPALSYDVCSIGVGSMPAGVDSVSQHPGLVSIKPMPSTLERIDQVVDQLRARTTPVRVAVVGAGAAGLEVAFGIHARLVTHGLRADITLVDSGDQPLPGFRERTSRLAARLLSQRGITFAGGNRVAGVDGHDLLLDGGRRMVADLILWVTSAAPPPVLSRLGLQLDQHGFVRAERTLLSETDDSVFVVGDTAAITGETIDRAGVYAVRQGPVLWENLQRRLAGRTLREFRPQRDFLRLLSTGDGSAIVQWRGFTSHGPRWWRLKDRIDSQFMQMHESQSPRRESESPMSGRSIRGRSSASDSRGPVLNDESTMRCRGCGSKAGSRVLSEVLQQLRSLFPNQPDGFLQSDDTALLPRGPGLIAASTDFFPAFLDDPWLTGRIAAIHAMSDLFACGISPTSALAMITLPDSGESLQREALLQVLHGAIREFSEAGAVLLGGHTTVGNDLSVGFTVFGNCDGVLPWRKSALRSGDDLILTKPVGTGVILAARDQGRSVAAHVDRAVESMLRSNAAASCLASQFPITAATDVTGFGLGGHLSEMLEQSGVNATLDLAAVPLLSGARALLDAGVRSSLHDDNLASVSSRLTLVSDGGLPIAARDPRAAIVCDPQTSGGLLVGIASSESSRLLEALIEQSDADAAIVGRVTSGAS